MKNTLTFELNEALRKLKAKQEDKDAYVTQKLLTDLLKNKVENLHFKKVREFGGFDLVCKFTYKGKRHKQAFEIKQRTKTKKMLEKYPTSELKMQKYEHIMQTARFYLCNEVFYIQLINEDFAMIYNLKEIDWNDVQTTYWNIKTETFWKDSPTKKCLTYFIPYTMGKRFENLKQYYKQYYEEYGKDTI